MCTEIVAVSHFVGTAQNVNSGLNSTVLLDPKNYTFKLSSSPTEQHRPFGMEFLFQLRPPVHWNISNGRSKLKCTIVRLTVTDS